MRFEGAQPARDEPRVAPLVELSGEGTELARDEGVFRSLLFGDVMITWLLGAKPAPNPPELKLRARRAASAFMRLYAA